MLLLSMKNKDDNDSYMKDSRRANPVFKNMKVNRSAVQRDKKNHKVRAEYKHKVQQEVDAVDDYEMRFLTDKFGEDDNNNE